MNVLSCGQAPIQFPAAEKGTLALLYKGRFPLLQRTGRCSRGGVSLYLQIGVLGLNASFLRLLECGLRLGGASDCTLRLERISRFPAMKTVPWRQNTVISWLCRSLRVMTARMPVWTCIWVVCRTFLSLPKQTLGQLLCPFDATHLGVAQLVTAEGIPLAVLGNIPQLAPQALCAVIQPPADQLCWRGLDLLFQSVLYLGLIQNHGRKLFTKTTKEPRTKQAIPPTETAAQYKERSPLGRSI